MHSVEDKSWLPLEEELEDKKRLLGTLSVRHLWESKLKEDCFLVRHAYA